MSETEHTPGEWEYKNHAVVTQEPDEQVMYGDGPFSTAEQLLADYGGYVICETISESNGRFVAKSPEMFSALVDLIESENAGIAILREMAYCVYCDHAAFVAGDVEHADDCPIVAARNLIETLSGSEKEIKNDDR